MWIYILDDFVVTKVVITIVMVIALVDHVVIVIICIDHESTIEKKNSEHHTGQSESNPKIFGSRKPNLFFSELGMGWD